MALVVTPLAVLGAALASFGTLGVAVVVVYLVQGRTRKVSSTDKLVLVWLIYNAFTHFILVRRAAAWCACRTGCGCARQRD